MSSCVKRTREASGAGWRGLPKLGGRRRTIGAPTQGPAPPAVHCAELPAPTFLVAAPPRSDQVTRPGRARWHCLMLAPGGPLAGWQSGRLAVSGGAREMPDSARACHDPLGGCPFQELVVCARHAIHFCGGASGNNCQIAAAPGPAGASGSFYQMAPAPTPGQSAAAAVARVGDATAAPRGRWRTGVRGNANPLRRRQSYRAGRLATGCSPTPIGV
jgi:hypothetical protein